MGTLCRYVDLFGEVCYNKRVYGPPPDEQEIEQQNDTETVSGEDVSQSETNTDNSETTEEEDVQ